MMGSGTFSNLTVRFGVGLPGAARSSVWRVWTESAKSDVYVAVRSMAGVMKISLHRSGVCHAALTKSFEARLPQEASLPDGSRYLDRWMRPTHVGSQLVVPCRLVFPASELRHRGPDEEQLDPSIKWLPPPPSTKMIDVACTYSGQVFGSDEWPWKQLGAEFIARVMLGNGEVFWLVYIVTDVDAKVPDAIEKARREMAEPGTWTFGELDLKARSARLIVAGTDTNRTKMLVDASTG